MRADKLLMIILFACLYSCNEVEKVNSSVASNSEENKIERSETEEKITSEMTSQDTVNQAEIVKQIEELSNNINKELHQYDTIQRIVFGYSGEGSDLTGYHDRDKNTKKILAKHAGEYGNLIEHYYFDNSSLVLVYSKNSIYDKPIFESENIREAAFIEDYCYFNKDVLLKWTSQYTKIKEAATIDLLKDEIRQTGHNNEVLHNDSNYVKQSQELTKYAKEYLSKLSK